MKNTLKFTKLFILIFATMFVSCERVESFETDAQQGVSPEIIAGLSNIGFDTETHEVYWTEDGYVVEGDIVLPLKDEEILNPQLIKQRRVDVQVDCENITNIRVRSGLNKRLSGYVKIACDRWNSTNDVGLKFVYAGNTTKNFDVNIVNNNSNIFASADYPSAGKPGKLVRFNWRKTEKFVKENLKWSQAQTDEHLVDVITHGLGHTIGLAHSDGLGNPSTASYIPYTPGTGTDKYSIMNSFLENWNNRITTGDTKAVNYIYKDCD